MANLLFHGQKNVHPISSGFGVIRDFPPYYGKGHEGIDYVDHKRTPVYCEINGVVDDIEYQPKVYGNKVTIRTHLGYLTKDLEGCMIYHFYAHLFSVDKKITIGQFIPAGNLVGQMGNTGECRYLENGEWVTVTEEQSKDPTFEPGTHLHLSILTSLNNIYLIELMKTRLVLENQLYFLNQWGHFFIHPEYFYKFLESY